jgi:hypothetical protein
MFKKMASIIQIPTTLNEGEIHGPEPTLKDQINSGEILKYMYHKKELNIDYNKKAGEALFYDNFKRNC